MAYAATWTNGNAQGRVEPAVHSVRDEDAAELAGAANRRRRLVYLTGQDFSTQTGAGKVIRAATLANQTPPPFRNFRDAVTDDILEPVVGSLGGSPPTPADMDWLWPVADADENKVVVPWNAEAEEVALLGKVNGTSDWTDPVLAGGQTAVRAVHFNELRQAIEWVRRGRWRLPIYFSAGIFSQLPNTSWVGNLICNNGQQELRAIGFVIARTADSPPLGLTNVAVQSSTRIELTVDTACQVEIYHCLRTVDFVEDRPTWNEYDPSESLAWTSPGGIGDGDASFIGSLDLEADVTGQLSSSALATALQAMIDGSEQNFLVRRSDTGNETVGISGALVVEFDLNSPPN